MLGTAFIAAGIGALLAAGVAVPHFKERERKKIKEVNRMLSHGVRMPISIAMGYAELIEKNIVTDCKEKEQYIQKICEQLTYLNDYMKRVLERDYSLVNQKPTELIKEQLNLTCLLKSMLQDMKHMASQKNISIVLHLPKEDFFLMADKILLKKVFYNLLENSMKYMGKPGSITVTLSPVEGDRCLIVWEDNGMGMPPEETEHILDMNYQGENRNGGSGMGLYIVRQAIELHGGSVSVKSLRGEGMALYLSL